MSGIKSFNIPAFQVQAAKYEQALGCSVACPYELDDIHIIEWCLKSPDGVISITSRPSGPGPKTWAEFLTRDLTFIAEECSGIALMPDWRKSRGARVEVAFGIELGLPFIFPDFSFLNSEEMREYARKNTFMG